MQHLFTEFKPVTAAEWKAQLAKDLKGDTFESLTWKNENGFDIQPFYTAEDLHRKYEPAFTHADWDICVKGRSNDGEALNKHLLQSLNSGASAVAIQGEADLSIALKDIELNYIRSTFYTPTNRLPDLKALLEKHCNPEELHCSVFPENLSTQQDLKAWVHTASQLKDFKHTSAFGVDGMFVHNQNCFAYYEVAVILSLANEYLQVLSKGEAPFQKLVVKAGVSTDYFIQIAKLRAIRRLWKLLAAEYKINDSLHLIVETSSTNKALSDTYTNLLRTTVEAMAAVSGGCNELIVNEFDFLLPSDGFRSQRLAINQQLILKEESYLDKMADVACGSYYIESITDAIANKALETMKGFESEGGYFKCLEKNKFREEIAGQAGQREAWLSEYKQIAIGVNKFRNEKEKMSLSPQELKHLEQLQINNPVLKADLDHYFKEHA